MLKEKSENQPSSLNTKKIDILHWGLLCVITLTILLGGVSNRILSFTEKSPTILIHQALGITALILSITLFIRTLSKNSTNSDKSLLASLTQRAQAFSLILIALSGLSIALIDTPFFELYAWLVPEYDSPRELFSNLFFVHSSLIKAFLILLSLHILGAVKHHFFDKGDKLNKMLGR